MKRARLERSLILLVHFLVAWTAFLKGRAFLAVEHLILVSSAFSLDLDCDAYTFPGWLAPRQGASHGILLGATMVPALATALDPGELGSLGISQTPDHLRITLLSSFGLLFALALIGPKNRRGFLRPRTSLCVLLSVAGVLLCRHESVFLPALLEQSLGTSPFLAALIARLMTWNLQDPAQWFADHLGWVILGPSLTLAFLAGARRSLTVGEAASFGHGALLVCWVSIPRIHDRWIEHVTWDFVTLPVRDPGYPIDLVFQACLAGLLAWVGAIITKVVAPPGVTRRVLQRLLWMGVSALVLDTVLEDARGVVHYTLQDRTRAWLVALWAALMLVALLAMGLASGLIIRELPRVLGSSSSVSSASSSGAAEPAAPPSPGHRVAKILIRKGFHLLGVALMLPGLRHAPDFLGLALAIAFFALAALEATRLLGFSIVADPIDRYMRPFTDTRDAGQVLTTHFSLLLGLAVPLWGTLALTPSLPGAAAAGSGFFASAASAALSRSPSATLLVSLVSHAAQHVRAGLASLATGLVGGAARKTAALITGSGGADPAAIDALVWRPGIEACSGIVTLGVMDVAASLGGTLIGGPRITSDSDKTVIGTVLGIFSGVLASLALSAWSNNWATDLIRLLGVPSLFLGGGGRGVPRGSDLLIEVLPILSACVGSGLIEALTDQIDNMAIPYWHWAILLASKQALTWCTSPAGRAYLGQLAAVLDLLMGWAPPALERRRGGGTAGLEL